jgi:LEA14-like dessication related protein
MAPPRARAAHLPAIFLALALLLPACAEKPTMQLHHAELRSASLQGVGLDVVLKVENPNSFDIQIRNVRALVTLLDRYTLPELVFSPNQWLPAGQSTLVRIPMQIPLMLIPRIASDSTRMTVLTYTVKGSTDVTAVRALGVDKDDYPIDEQGSILRSDLLAAAGIAL